MKKETTRQEQTLRFPYTVKRARINYFLLLLIYGIIWASLLYRSGDLLDELQEGHLVIIVGSIFIFIWVPLMIFGGFFYRIVFGYEEIERTSLWRRQQRWSYSNIKNIQTSSDGGHLRISFDDGRSIRIWKSEANLQYLVALLESKAIFSE